MSDTRTPEQHTRMGGAAFAAKRAAARRRGGITLAFAPMIDVVFLLLVYFMLVAELRPREAATPAALPAEAAAAVDPFDLPPEPIRVFVDSQGEDRNALALTIDFAGLDDVRTAPRLTQRLEGLRGVALTSDQAFIVAPAPAARWEHAVRALRAIEQAGFDKVRFGRPGG